MNKSVGAIAIIEYLVFYAPIAFDIIPEPKNIISIEITPITKNSATDRRYILLVCFICPFARLLDIIIDIAVGSPAVDTIYRYV